MNLFEKEIYVRKEIYIYTSGKKNTQGKSKLYLLNVWNFLEVANVNGFSYWTADPLSASSQAQCTFLSKQSPLSASLFSTC